jgi:hypothetical protein
MTLIETKTLGASATSVEFTSIPQTFTDLVIRVCSRTDRAGQFIAGIALEFNGLSTDFTVLNLFGNGSTVTANTDLEARGGITAGASPTASTFGNSEIYIANYAGATNKAVNVDSVYENNATTAHQWFAATLWSNTSAISSVKLIAQDSSNFISDSTFSLYGITKGSDGIVTTS